MPVTILEVEREKDLPFLAEINRRTFLQELPSNFAYRPAADNGNQLVGFFQDRLIGRLTQPNARMFKAVDQDTNQIYGFACWRHVIKDSEPVVPAPGSPDPSVAKTTAAPNLPPFMNAEFTVATGAEVKQLEDHMKGEHYYLTAFGVHPDHQNKGIGAQLLKHFIQVADDAGLPSWLVAFPGSHSLYLRHGFVDVDYRDNDLNAWDNNRCRGYGIYRAYAMVRQPQVNS
ncbi:acyl-CoA N-acyltransferase [Xylaria cf. heliscus]|nr:acyl-CoA N-acyltransferase [Xylaria cf. heliscus]